MKRLLSILRWMSLIALVSTLSAHAGQALEWSELEDAAQFVLRQDIQLENSLAFRGGQEFHLTALNGIEGLPMIYAEAYAVHCPDMEARMDDVTLILPRQPEGQDPGRDRRVAVDLKPGCHLGIYIEAADYYSLSFFEAK